MQFSGFRPKRTTFGGIGLPEVQRWVIANSVTMKQGQPVKILPSQGVDIADAVTDKIYGYCVGFVSKNGLPLSLGVSGIDYDGTFTESPDGDTYVAASDNQTDKQVAALIIPAKGLVVSALLDAAKGTTTNSDKVGSYFDILTTDCSKLDESTVTTTVANYMAVPGRSAADPTDPDDPTATRILVIAIELQEGQ